VVPTVGKLKKGYMRKARPDCERFYVLVGVILIHFPDEHQDFISLATSLAASLRSAIFTDQVHSSNIKHLGASGA
jgi:hypothetical protein